MRKIISILLLFTLGLSSYGYHLFFSVQIVTAKKEMKDFLQHQQHETDLVLFHFTAAQVKLLEWENEHEFRYEGRMYDVVEQTNEEGNFVIRCIQDEKETALLNAFLKTTKNSRQNAVVQVLLTPFLLPRIEVLQPAERPLSFNFPSLSFYLKTPDISVAIPPPEKV